MSAPATSFLSEITEFARSHLAQQLFPNVDVSYRVAIDSPSGTQKAMEADTTKVGVLNLFFYRFEPSGFQPDVSAHDRWHIRARCLVTAFSIPEKVDDATILAGEIDLRVLGSVMQYFHENPVLADAARGLHLEVVPGTLSSEEINQIWASQHEVPYRPSLLYEFALLPIVPKVWRVPPAIVVAGGLNPFIHGEMARNANDTVAGPRSPHMAISTSADWTPLLSFLANATPTQTLRVQTGDATPVKLWIAGVAGTSVRLDWQVAKDGEWRSIAAEAAWPVANIPAQPAELSGKITPEGTTSDGVQQPAATVDVTPPSALAGTYLLYARRAGGGASNPLMLHVGAAP